MTSSTVCALAAKEKNTMAANTGKKKRTTLVNSINGVTRKSTSITPPNPTLSGNTPNGRDLKGEHLITRKRRAALSYQTFGLLPRSFGTFGYTGIQNSRWSRRVGTTNGPGSCV